MKKDHKNMKRLNYSVLHNIYSRKTKLHLKVVGKDILVSLSICPYLVIIDFFPHKLCDNRTYLKKPSCVENQKDFTQKKR